MLFALSAVVFGGNALFPMKEVSEAAGGPRSRACRLQGHAPHVKPLIYKDKCLSFPARRMSRVACQKALPGQADKPVPPACPLSRHATHGAARTRDMRTRAARRLQRHAPHVKPFIYKDKCLSFPACRMSRVACQKALPGQADRPVPPACPISRHATRGAARTRGRTGGRAALPLHGQQPCHNGKPLFSI